MSNWTPSTRAGSEPAPSPTVFDPSAERAAALGLEPVGTVVLLLAATPDLRWSAEAAIELCTAWAQGGRRIVLADLHLENPLLHEQVGAPNLEGVVDVFLYGASIARSARPVRGRGFYLIPSGTYEPDAEAIYQHPRWPKLIAGFRDASASLVLFVPAESADLEAVSRWAGDVVVLGAGDARLTDAVADAGLEVRAVLLPPGTELPVADDDHTAEAPLAAYPHADRELDLPPAPVREPRRRRRGLGAALFLLLAVVALAAAGFWVARNRPELLQWSAAQGTAASDSAGAQAAAAAAPTRVGERLAYSVQVIAYRTLPEAQQQLATERRRLPEVPFFISPEEIQGVVYYKIMAGLVSDTLAAGQLKEQLVEAGAVNAEDATGAWALIKPAALAFDLGEFSDEMQAQSAADSLLARQIPAYPVVVPYSDGSHRWQLYAGAYRDSGAAEAMSRRLAEVGIEPKLVLRVGQPAPAPAQGAE